MNSKLLLDKIYPVGSIYMSINNTNPSTLFGGTWERIAKGRTLVGVDENDGDFNTVSKTGGSKYLQAHTHAVLRKWQGVGFETPYSDACQAWNIGDRADAIVGNTSSTGTGDSGNLQPYYTCYIFVRTA